MGCMGSKIELAGMDENVWKPPREAGRKTWRADAGRWHVRRDGGGMSVTSASSEESMEGGSGSGSDCCAGRGGVARFDSWYAGVSSN